MPLTDHKPKSTALAKDKTAKRARERIASRAAILLKQVSDPTRLQVIVMLSEGEKHVGAMSNALGQSQPAVSHHLALLRHGGIIAPRRQGKNNFYSLTDIGADLAKVVKNLVGEPLSFENDPAKKRSAKRDLRHILKDYIDDPETWFQTPNPMFGGRRPIELVNTPQEALIWDRIEAAKLGQYS